MTRTRGDQPRAATMPCSSANASTGPTANCSRPASSREISIRSSTNRRSRTTSPTSSRAAGRASSGNWSRCSRSSDAAATNAVTGVRSSCATSAVNRRSRACAADSAAIFDSSAAAISLKVAAQTLNSSRPRTGRRVASRPSVSARAARLARPTGSNVRRANA
ncbi:hypothetical protein PSN01_05432 [Micromonospora saelicesensis]|nr:hypothetical protein PSN01_05432 [Micromonospora saelicesensis]